MMAPGQQIRVVNVVPNMKIKKELSEDECEDVVACRICSKTFASEVALRNHARMEHIDVFAKGEPGMWTQPIETKKSTPQTRELQERLIKMKTEEIISSMAPTDLMSLASEDVSYIIIKAENAPGESQQRKRRADRSETDKDKMTSKKDKEIRPITGPFECLQPSTLVADGTCHQIFFSCCEYSAHFRDEHTRRRKRLRCQVCEKPLVGGADEQHSPFSCEVCGAGFQNNKDLSQHMATDHIKLKPFQCDVCHKRFTQQGGVQQHMRMHTGDRPFSCTFCPKAFTQKSGLDQHLRIHTKVKPYRCVICSKTFCQSVHLRQHMRTHTNVSPFQCGICSKRCVICSKTFCQSVHLRQHMRTHTNVSPFQCGICSKRFKQSSHLNYHLKNHNQVNMSEEQKVEYRKLVSLMNEDKQNVVLFEGDRLEMVEISDVSSQMVTVEMAEGEDGELEGVELEEGVEMVEGEEVEEVEEVETVESEVLMDDEEQMLAEQSIQVSQGEEETYILGDVISDM